MKNRLIFSVLLISQVSLGQDAVDLTKGTPAPFTGILISPTINAKVQSDLNAYDTLKLVDASNKRIIDSLNTEVSVTSTMADKWRKEAETQAEARTAAQNSQFWKNAGFFTLGTAVTILIAFATVKASK